MTDRERAICSRIREIREQIKWSQADFATELGISRPRLVSIEYGHTPLRFEIAFRILLTFDIHAKWLATGQGEARPFHHRISSDDLDDYFEEMALFSKIYDANLELFDPWPKPAKGWAVPKAGPGFDVKEAICNNVRAHCENIKFRDADASVDLLLKMADCLLENLGKYIADGRATRTPENQLPTMFHISPKKDLPKCSEIRNTAAYVKLPHTMEQLLAEVRRLTKPAGMKAALAKYLDVPQARVSEWLADKYKPSGKVTLKLALWVSDPRERQPK